MFRMFEEGHLSLSV